MGEYIDLFAEALKGVQRLDRLFQHQRRFGEAAAIGQKRLGQRFDPVEISLPGFEAGIKRGKIPGLFFRNHHYHLLLHVGLISVNVL